MIPSGVTEKEIVSFEAKYRVVLPLDVRQYFMAANGTGDAMDEVLCRFWPLMEVKPVHDVLELERFNCPDRFAYPDCFLFADHCTRSWDYALQLTNDPTQPAPVFRFVRTDQLNQAAESGNVEIVKLLIQSKVDTTWKNAMGEDASSFARQKGDEEIIELLQ